MTRHVALLVALVTGRFGDPIVLGYGMKTEVQKLTTMLESVEQARVVYFRRCSLVSHSLFVP